MSENARRLAEASALAPIVSTQQHHQEAYDANVDYVINEYMERLGTRLNILETELKYAWRALDLLSQEYIKMWERLEKLEGLLYEQQSVISQLLDFYTTGGARMSGPGTVSILDSRLGELEVIREILGNGTVEDGLEEGLDVSRSAQVVQDSAAVQELDEMHVPDEAFYRSLNQAYREDLGGLGQAAANQLGMIWEEREDNGEEPAAGARDDEGEDGMMGEEEPEEVYSALDYKDYRGNSPCISDQDIAQLSRIDSIDHVAIEKLNELDRLSSKLQQDSDNIRQLQRKLMESPLSMNQEEGEQSKEVAGEGENLNWSFSSGARDQEELLLLAKSELPNSLSNIAGAYSTRPSSRLSVTDSVIGTDNEVAEALAGGLRTPTSPRRRLVSAGSQDSTTCSAPFTTVTGRLAYSAAVHNVDLAISNSKNPFYCSGSELNQLIAATYETAPCSGSAAPCAIFAVVKSERAQAQSPTPSACSLRTRQDGYIGAGGSADDAAASPSPPPPAPMDLCESFLMPNSTMVPGPQPGPSPVFLGTSDAVPCSSISALEPSSRSPKTSPKRPKSNIVAAKSDSGLSSMSGWSSLEKSPGSPKAKAAAALNYHHLQTNSRPFFESDTDTVSIQATSSAQQHNGVLPGGHHLSAFTTVKSPCSLETAEGYGNFVPAPAPASDINVSPRRKSKHHHHHHGQQQQQAQQQSRPHNTLSAEFIYRNEQQPAIYSVAGSNRETYTSVYTSNSADYINQTINYPDLVEPYENNEYTQQRQQQQQQLTYNSLTTTAPQPRRKSLSRMYSTSNGSDGLANHEGYKTAMYRTMFPSGNITDALTYYPTSSRYEQGGQPGGEWPQGLPDYQEGSGAMDASSADYPPQPIYENQQQIEQNRAMWNQRQEIPYLELDLRNRNVPEYMQQQQQQQHQQFSSQQQQQQLFQQQHLQQHQTQQQQQQLQQQQQQHYQQQQQQQQAQMEASGVIMTQSGYITMSEMTDTTGSQMGGEKSMKKMKRGNTLKTAMSQVSHWLPDLHLKRHRSYSLPSGVRREDLEKTRQAHHAKSNVAAASSAPRKKKKNTIVSTVSGILQKAKRKSYFSHHTQSLSDPEQSENEWVLNRASSMISDDDRSDSYSLFSTDTQDTATQQQQQRQDFFAKVTPKPKLTPQHNQQQPQQQQQQQQRRSSSYQPETGHDFEEHLRISPLPPDASPTKKYEDNDSELLGGGDEEISGKSTGSGSSGGIFATVGSGSGENKRSSASSEKSDETIITDNKMLVVVGGASMEFAVSRALGKYRQQKQTTPSLSDESDGVVIDEVTTDTTNGSSGTEVQQQPQQQHQQKGLQQQQQSDGKLPLAEQKSTDSQDSETTRISLNNDGMPSIEGSPSAFRMHGNRFLPRHQASLEIPGSQHREDDDARSTHSWRSTSRVSSRRQSTEDSIDSEDEWYCYELRKLEEMERQTQLEVDMGETLREEPELEEYYEPYEEVKEKMSFVLRELRMKAPVIPGVLDEDDRNLQVIQSARHREAEQQRKSIHLDEAHLLFEKIRDFRAEETPEPVTPELPEAKGIDEEYREEEEYEEEEEREDQEDQEDQDQSSGETSGPDSPQISLDEEDENLISSEFALCHVPAKEPEPEVAQEALPGPVVAPGVPTIQIEPANKEEQLPKEVAGQMGSKWKLLKALKERKAEEKGQVKVPESSSAEKEKVSMLGGIVQKLYEIHVKT